MGRLDNLGAALRHLRLHGGAAPRKQLEVAKRAGVTGAMLSSYERGEENPRIETLDKVLTALDADLVQLQWALDLVEASAGAPADAPYPPPRPTAWEVREGPPTYRPVPLPGPLNDGEEEALGEMINGFLAWVRYTRKLRTRGNGDGEERAREEAGEPREEEDGEATAEGGAPEGS